MPLSDSPSLLFHYTDAGGLKGIVEDTVFWGTDIRYLNDSREFKYGMKGLVNALEVADQQSSSALSSDARVACADYFEALRTGQDIRPDATVPKYVMVNSVKTALKTLDGLGLQFGEHLMGSYVVSLTRHADSLSQWQGYGNNGNGFAIGFDQDMLHKVTYRKWDHHRNEWTDSPTSQPIKVEYGRKARAKLVDDVIEALVDGSGEYVEQFALYTVRAVGLALRAAALVKHPGFKNEAEWRLIASDLLQERDIKFQPSGTFSLLPYVEMSFPKDAIRTIVVGPGRHTKLRISAVNQFLAVNGYSDVDVVPSSVPFRG
ncbi:DUF2971 domain-containing protein (plasmid) [Rhodococcus sp. USK10]|uniref:DUF2971 domain-containing protein n=1 Tax=Rhodococcus sp. USK10 TaxID=2789739 RepID=UPI001C5E65E7|nr:DUF2971 domain-containing protein [Rhodococcus sp. USK10]QYA99724.1 DUF2971 domain-containing protein [Rhodococcus sp. USK10]